MRPHLWRRGSADEKGHAFCDRPCERLRMIEGYGEIQGGGRQRLVSCPEDVSPHHEPAPPRASSLGGPLPGSTISTREDEDRQWGGELKRKCCWHIGEGDGVLFSPGHGINLAAIDWRALAETVRGRELGEVRGRPAFDRQVMEFDAPAFNQNGFGLKINEHVGLRPSGELDLLFQNSGGFLERCGIGRVQCRNHVLFGGPAH